jgi:hypothetical protein
MNDNVFDNGHHNNADILLNSFLNTHVQVFYSCFPNVNFNDWPNKKPWIIAGRRISCKRTRDLYLLTRNNNAMKLKQYYKLYCEILTNVIKEVKRTNYNKQIVNSYNKVNTTWNTIKSATREKVNVDDISLSGNEGDKINNCKVNSESFNNYFNHC